jgi:hypothetical protein
MELKTVSLILRRARSAVSKDLRDADLQSAPRDKVRWRMPDMIRTAKMFC